MKKTVFCMAALALGASLFAQGRRVLISELQDGVKIHSGTEAPGGTDGETAPISPSRSATLKAGQYLDIAYPGTGWIYLGETDGSSLLRYEKREIGDGDSYFTLQAKSAGTTTLHFYKSDALAGNYIDDYLSVTIAGTSRNGEHVDAPAYADIVPPRPSFTQSAAVAASLQERRPEASEDPAESVQYAIKQQAENQRSEFPSQAESTEAEDDRGATVIQTSGGSPASAGAGSPSSASTSGTDGTAAGSGKKEDTAKLSEDEILALAQASYDAKDYEECLSYLEDFFDKAAMLTDEGLFLKGRTLETPSSVRNIKEALASYRAIVSNYPESDLWDDAARRIGYIQRIYFDIR